MLLLVVLELDPIYFMKHPGDGNQVLPEIGSCFQATTFFLVEKIQRTITTLTYNMVW